MTGDISMPDYLGCEEPDIGEVDTELIGPPELVFPLVRTHQIAGIYRPSFYGFGIWPGRIICGRLANLSGLNVQEARAGHPAAFDRVRWRGAHVDSDPDAIESMLAELDSDNIIFKFTIANKTIKAKAPLAESQNLFLAFGALLGDRADVEQKALEKLGELKRRRSDRLTAKKRKGAAGVAPFRSKALGLACKILGVALLLAGAAFLVNALGGAGEETATFDFLLAGISLLIMGNIVFRIGRRIGAPAYEDVVAGDPRAPVLFLRSFDSEDVESPAPGASMSEQFAANGLYRIPYAAFVLAFIESVLEFFYSLFGTFAERVEEQIARSVRRIGPLTAIGEPGERIAAAGAARAYLRDEEWQQFILDLLQRARAVLIQLESTAGTWWEFEQCIRMVAPNRLLVMLTANYGSDSAYEKIRAMTSGVLPKPLPVYLGDAGFIVFDENWNPHLLTLYFHPKFVRHLMPSRVNYHKSLAPFVSRFLL